MINILYYGHWYFVLLFEGCVQTTPQRSFVLIGLMLLFFISFFRHEETRWKSAVKRGKKICTTVCWRSWKGANIIIFLKVCFCDAIRNKQNSSWKSHLAVGIVQQRERGRKMKNGGKSGSVPCMCNWTHTHTHTHTRQRSMIPSSDGNLPPLSMKAAN